jgi:hypothetical protein
MIQHARFQQNPGADRPGTLTTSTVVDSTFSVAQNDSACAISAKPWHGPSGLVPGSENRANWARCGGVLTAERAHRTLTLTTASRHNNHLDAAIKRSPTADPEANHLAAQAGRHQIHPQHGECDGYGPDAVGPQPLRRSVQESRRLGRRQQVIDERDLGKSARD